MNYEQFVLGKVKQTQKCGFEPTLELNSYLFDWQRVIVKWAIRQGRAALFEDCGLGKTLQQLEWARHVQHYTSGYVLILAPLAVAEQTVSEGRKFGIDVIHVLEGQDVTHPGIYITNYERLDHFDPAKFDGVILDESSILKSFTGKTRQELTEAFRKTPHRLCCTATPAPNDFTELGQHADFLGICTPAEMLATWFINDTADTGTWRLKGHAEDNFWQWVGTWAASVSAPSDIGFSDDGFKLPPLQCEIVTVGVNHKSDGESDMLFVDATATATSIHKEMRRTLSERAAKAAEIANNETGPVVVWCNTNDEADTLKDAIPDAVEVRGSDKAEHKERKLMEFTEGKARVIITKPSIAGYGLNWQHCNKCVFVGLSYSFEDFYQAVRRCYRFGQKKPVTAYIIQADTENNVLPVIRRKIAQHAEMRSKIKFNPESIKNKMSTLKTDINTVTSQDQKTWTMHNGDCVRIISQMPDASIGFSVFSPPFADLFTYSNDIQDMGNCASMKDFMEQFDYLIQELYRVMMPGREIAVHCVDLLSTKWKHGKIEFQDFSGSIIRAFRERGFLNHSRITIWKDPVVEMQRTKAHGLLYKTLRADSSASRVGAPDYLLVFRKPGENPVPIEHDTTEFPLDKWQEIASPVWWTVNQTRVLDYECARDTNDEKHICPLQLDIIERALFLWSRKDDLVLSPFAGVGSEGYCSVKMGRRFVGCELKKSYFDRACVSLRNAEEESQTLFKLA